MVEKGTDVLKEGFAKMTKGGVIMDVSFQGHIYVLTSAS